jgi:hypothetical protein
MKREENFVFVEKLIRQLMLVPPRERLELLLGGLVAAADELRLGEAQLIGVVKTAIAQRAVALEQLRNGGPLLVAPNGQPLRREESRATAVDPGAIEPLKTAQEADTVPLGPGFWWSDDVDAGLRALR